MVDMDLPLISIIIPAYQAESTLRRAVESALNIEAVPLEVIVVDDGSTDGTALLIDEMARNDSRVRPIHQANQGRSAARNNGFAASCGKWVMFVDADDYFLPGASDLIESSVKAAVSDLVIFGCVIRGDEKLSKWAGTAGCISITQKESVPHLLRASAKSLAESMVYGGWDSTTPGQRHYEQNACWARLYKRAAVNSLIPSLPDIWAPFPVGLTFSEDRLFNYAYLHFLGDGDVEFCPGAVYLWDLSQSATVGNVKAEDALGLSDYLSCLRQLERKDILKSEDLGAMFAREAMMQFRRGVTALPEWPGVSGMSPIWHEVLSGDDEKTYLLALPADARGDGGIWRLGSRMLARGIISPTVFLFRLLFRIKSLTIR